jgi:hypothetical protein
MKSTRKRKRPRGRPKVGSTPINVRLTPEELKRLDLFIGHMERVGRPEAIRRLMKVGMDQYPPPGWGKDPLSRFFNDATLNRWHTFHSSKTEYRRLEQIDKCFLCVSANWKSPQTPIEPFLFLSCHSAYRVACETAAAGELQEAYTQLRSALEYAGYALHMNLHPGHDKVWSSRSDNDISRRAAKGAFKAVDVQASIKRKNPVVGAHYNHLYNRCIDFGAHPNEQGLFSRIEKIDLPNGGVTFNLMYLQPEGLPKRLALRTTAQVGICTLLIFGEVFGNRFEESGANKMLGLLSADL